MKQKAGYCSDCVYCGWFTGVIPYSDYLFRTNQRRPCPPGEGCTVKVSKEVKQKKKRGKDIKL